MREFKRPYEWHERLAICEDEGVVSLKAQRIADCQPITHEQLRHLHTVRTTRNVPEVEFRRILGTFGYESSKQVTMGEFNAVIEALDGA